MNGRRNFRVSEAPIARTLLLAFLAWLAGVRFGAAQLSFEVSASLLELVSCLGGEVDISYVVRNPAAQSMPVAGFQAFLRFPAALFDLVAYREIDLTGSEVVNAPRRFGTGFTGFDGCDATVADDWDDGLGADVVAVLASAYGEGASGGPVRAAVATLGGFRFRLRPGVTAQKDPAVFALE